MFVLTFKEPQCAELDAIDSGIEKVMKTPPTHTDLPYVKRLSFIVSLAALASLTATSIDIMLPAIPMIAGEYGERAEAGGIIVSAYFLGFGPGQLIWGPLADKYGRMRPLMFGLLGFVLATIACIFASSLTGLAFFRLVQGIFGGSATVIARAIARDQGGGKDTAHLLATIMMIFGLAPLLAPIVGSGLLLVTDWRGLFWFLVAFGFSLMVLAAVYVRPGVRLHEQQVTARARLTWKLVKQLLLARDFRMGSSVMATLFMGYAGVLSAGAAMMEARYGVSATEFGPWFAIAASAIIIGPALSKKVLAGGGL